MSTAVNSASVVTDEKSRKIEELKGLLGQAKVRLDAYRLEIEQRDKKIQQLQTRIKKMEKHEQSTQSTLNLNRSEIKLLENDSSQIVQQYQSRLLRYQTTLEENDKLIQSHQKQTQILQVTQKNTSASLEKLTDLMSKLVLDNTEVVTDSIDELCALQRLREGNALVDKAVFVDKVVQELRRATGAFLQSVVLYLQRRRELRLAGLKKEMALRRQIQGCQTVVQEKDKEISVLREQTRKRIAEHKKELELQKHEHSKKLPKEELNLEYIKNLFIKALIGPPDVVRMSIKVLETILKFTPEETKEIEKKIK